VQTAFAQANNILWRNLKWFVFATLLVVAAAWFFGNTLILQRFRNLLQTTKRFSAGDLSARSEFQQVGGEVGELASAFEQIASSLESRIREHEKTEEALKESEKRFHDFFEFSPDAILVEDYRGVVLDVNPAACRLHKMSREELIGKSAAVLVPESIRNVARREFVKWTTGDITSQENKSLASDGQVIPVEIRASRIHYAGRPAMLFHVRDITQHKKAEDALRDTNQQLAHALKKLAQTQELNIQRERLHAVGHMASGIAHDFNNALAPILGFTELLLRPGALDDREKAAGYLKLIHMAASDSKRVIAGLREFYRQKDEEGEFAPVSINHIIQQVVSLTEPKWKTQAQNRGLTIEVKTELGVIPQITASEAGLREMLANLVFNAVDAIRGDGCITLRSLIRDQSVILQVADTGSGMSEKVRTRCFEPFFSTKAEHGTGLGLSMVYGVVQRHGGTIDIQSKPGEGTTVTVSLPLNKSQSTARLQSVERQPPASFRILVVEDDPLVREVVCAQLEEDKHRPDSAEDGVEGLEKFKAGTYDLVLTDRAMPRMNGDQLAAEIKKIRPEMPVILLTGFGDTLEEDSTGPVDLVVGKPFTFNTLRESVIKVMKR
jgi:PAS domain S-box-containing protein